MNNRNFQYASVAGPTTSGTAITMANLVFTGAVDDRYMVIGSSAAGLTIEAFDASIEDAAGAMTLTNPIAPRDIVSDVYSLPMIFSYTLIATGFDLRITGNSVGTADLTMRQSCMAAFKMLGSDLTSGDYAAAGSSTTRSDGSYDTVTNSTVTIVKSGEYLIFANAFCRKDELTANFDIRLALNATTGYGQQSMRANSTTGFFPWAHMRKLTLTAGDVLTIQHKVTTTGTMITNNASVVALYIDDFPNVLEIEDTADASQNTADTDWHDHGNMNNVYALQPYKALLLSCGQYRRGGGSVDASMQTLYDGTTIQETRNESVIANGEATHFCAKALDPATGGQHSLTQQIKNHGTGITSAFISDGATAVLQMNNNATMRIRGNATIFGNAKMGL